MTRDCNGDFKIKPITIKVVGVAVAICSVSIPLGSYILGRERAFTALTASDQHHRDGLAKHEQRLMKLEDTTGVLAGNQRLAIEAISRIEKSADDAQKWRETFATEIRSRLTRIETKIEKGG